MKTMPKTMRNYIAKHKIEFGSKFVEQLDAICEKAGYVLEGIPSYYTWGSVTVRTSTIEDSKYECNQTHYDITILVENDIPTRILKIEEV